MKKAQGSEVVAQPSAETTRYCVTSYTTQNAIWADHRRLDWWPLRTSKMDNTKEAARYTAGGHAQVGRICLGCDVLFQSLQIQGLALLGNAVGAEIDLPGILGLLEPSGHIGEHLPTSA